MIVHRQPPQGNKYRGWKFGCKTCTAIIEFESDQEWLSENLTAPDGIVTLRAHCPICNGRQESSQRAGWTPNRRDLLHREQSIQTFAVVNRPA